MSFNFYISNYLQIQRKNDFSICAAKTRTKSDFSLKFLVCSQEVRGLGFREVKKWEGKFYGKQAASSNTTEVQPENMANKTPATVESSLKMAETVCPEQEVGTRDTEHPAYGNSSLYHFSVQEILERELDHLNS